MEPDRTRSGDGIPRVYSSNQLVKLYFAVPTTTRGVLFNHCADVFPDRSYPLSGVAEALRYVESCHARGKVTIAVA